jgi:hypothetical protein
MNPRFTNLDPGQAFRETYFELRFDYKHVILADKPTCLSIATGPIPGEFGITIFAQSATLH